MIELETVSQFMIENFEQVQVTNHGRHFLSRCRLCGDSKINPYKKRFNMDWNNGIPGWHCFNCGEHGSFYDIYSRIKGLTLEEARKELHKWNDEKIPKYVAKKSKRKKSKKKEEINREYFNWIKDDCYISPFTEGGIFCQRGIMAKQYINRLMNFYEERKIPIEYEIYICHRGRYKNRIIIPILDENRNIIYFQARRLPKSGLTPKYDNPQAPKELCILNEHRFDREKYIIVHEGLIDAFMVGNQGTSCLGKEVSDKLLKELLKLTNKGVIIALDNDTEAYKSLGRFMRKSSYAQKVRYFMYPKEFVMFDDINSIVKERLYLDVYELITQNSVRYSTAYTKLSILKMLGGNKRNENNSSWNRLYRSG